MTNNLLPPPPLNGGLYTGEPFYENAPWRNFPVSPTSAYLNHVNLRSANPPVQAIFQMQQANRPGNTDSDPQMPGVARFVGDSKFGPFSSIMCMPCLKKVECSCENNCDCKSLCTQNKVDKCPCKDSSETMTKWIKID